MPSHYIMSVANSDGQDEMPQNVASHQGMHCLAIINDTFSNLSNLDNLNSNPFELIMYHINIMKYLIF